MVKAHCLFSKKQQSAQPAIDESPAASAQELLQAPAQEAGVPGVPGELEPLDDDVPVVPELRW